MNLHYFFLLFEVYAASVFNGMECTFWGRERYAGCFFLFCLDSRSRREMDGGIISGTCDYIPGKNDIQP